MPTYLPLDVKRYMQNCICIRMSQSIQSLFRKAGRRISASFWMVLVVLSNSGAASFP